MALWQEQFGGIEPDTLLSLFQRAMRTCKFFPKVSEILEPLVGAEAKAAPEAAEEAWARVLEIRRLHWNPDIPGPFRCALARLSDRVRQAARAAGVFRDFESIDALHTWAKKRFVESFLAYGERELHLLPEGEIKNLIADIAEAKALPATSEDLERDWKAMRARSLAYAEKLKGDPSQQPDLKRAIRELTFQPSMHSLEEQKRILREKGFAI